MRRHATREDNRLKAFVEGSDSTLSANVLMALILLFVLLPSPADAHMGTGLAGGFVSGFLHPLSGADHMLAMVSVGLWGAFLGRPMVVALPVIFPNMMSIGAGIGMAGIPLPPVELGIAVSVFVLGLMILFAVRAPNIVALAVVALFGLFHGYSHGVELPSAADPVGYSMGFVLCTGLLHVAGIALGGLRNLPSGTRLLRSGGAIIAVFGAMFLKQAIAT
ncbi:MAG: HupE/UreJ family protein [Sphingomicrobium sp.]